MSKKKKTGKWYDGLSAEEVQRKIDRCPKKKAEFMKWYAETPEYKKQYAQQYISPSTQAANTIIAYKHEEEPLDYGEVAKELEIQTKALRSNDLARIEDMLMAQAQTLDNIFHKQARKAKAQDYLNQFKIHMEMAFKAQRQCRTTLEALAEIKNPRPLAFIRQQNVGENVQVNNGQMPPASPARAEENLKSSNKILEDKRHETQWLDTGAPEAASGNDKELEAVGKKHRA